MSSKIKAMLVMDRERRAPLVGVLESFGIEVLAVGSCREAQRMPKTQPPVQVVVADRALPDGDWRRVLEIVEQSRRMKKRQACLDTARLAAATLVTVADQ